MEGEKEGKERGREETHIFSIHQAFPCSLFFIRKKFSRQ